MSATAPSASASSSVSAAAATTPGDVAPLQIELLHDAQAAGDRLEAIAERTGGGQSREAAERVDAILEQVRTQGDAALMELTERFDGVRPDPLRVPADELAAAWAATPTDLQEALQLAHRRIVDFHQRQKPADLEVTGVHGERLGRRRTRGAADRPLRSPARRCRDRGGPDSQR